MSDVYLVGGAVRDMLMGREPHDRDYVVVGSTVEEMLAKGFKQVGKDFPVFLDKDGDEYALARKEKKIGDKHTDFEFEFDPSVTLEEDILRRDISINGLAMDKNGKIIDYVNGQEDIKNKIIRVIDEDNFKLDPLRILRVARQYAQLKDFEIEPLTKRLCWKMVQEGMLKHLSAERVWKELEKALQPGYASHKFFEFLLEIHALEDWFPEFQKLFETPEIKEYHPLENSGKHTMACLKKYEELMSE